MRCLFIYSGTNLFLPKTPKTSFAVTGVFESKLLLSKNSRRLCKNSRNISRFMIRILKLLKQ
jgi:hypothetical protein